jgi:CheY-like chemotaxis protein
MPILALTADVAQKDIERAYAVGMQGHISKPIVLEDFYKKLYEVLVKDEKSLIKDSKKNKNRDNFKELTISKGLQHLNQDEKLYKTLLEDFKKMYANSAHELYRLLEQKQFKEARTKAGDIKDVALSIGAYNLYESAAEMQYTFEKAQRGNYFEILAYYQESLKKLLQDIENYLK